MLGPLIGAGAVVATAGAAAYHAMAPWAQGFGATFVGGSPSSKQIALTYDDGPNDPHTFKLLDVLANDDVRATFFLIGRYVERRPDIVRDLLKAGHAIGNHTLTHPSLALTGAEQTRIQLEECQRAVQDATGESPRLFRPPFGARRPHTLRIARSLGLEPVMNWTVDNNGAYDYAADTRGYTVGLLAEYHERNWAFRFEEALMPKVANGIDLDWSLRRSRAENYELELRPKFSGARGSVIRLLSFVNHANMGVYRDAINNYLAGKTSRPEITNHPEQTTVKYGFSVNAQQEITHALRLYSRFGWNEGQHESYAYTEVDQTVQIGGDYAGDRWKRKLDKTGAVFVSNAIKADHQRYLALGGRGFLLGDGALTYGRENIFEYYYNTHVWRGLFAAFDLQHINDPGYNRDRGPVLVPGLRVHLEF